MPKYAQSERSRVHLSAKKHNKRFAAFSCALSLVALHLSPAIAVPTSQLVTCIDLQSEKERISKNGGCRVTHEAQAKWHLIQPDSPIATGSNSKTLTVCSNRESSPASYQIIRNKCARHQVATLYSRSTVLAAKPVIAQAVSYGHDSSQISLAQDPAVNPDAPIAYYTITSSKGDLKKIYSWREFNLVISGLQALTTYTFTITATTADGTSPVSAASIPVTTPAYVPPAPSATSAPALAAPAFTLSSAAETKTAGTAIVGYSINSTAGGGTIASFAISPSAPAGMTFNSVTGILSGNPTTARSATDYTITATNNTGTSSQIFTLTVTAMVYTVGATGPGGGIVFYVANTPFSCGAAMTQICTYLEAAPSNWNSGSDPRRTWAQASPVNYQSTAIFNPTTPETASATAIGWGYRNTRAIILQGNSNAASSAAALADSYSSSPSGAVIDDWFLPSKNELNQLYLRKAIVGGLVESEDTYYFSSSGSSFFTAWVQSNFDGWQGDGNKGDAFYLRPIRAF